MILPPASASLDLKMKVRNAAEIMREEAERKVQTVYEDGTVGHAAVPALTEQIHAETMSLKRSRR